MKRTLNKTVETILTVTVLIQLAMLMMLVDIDLSVGSVEILTAWIGNLIVNIHLLTTYGSIFKR